MKLKRFYEDCPSRNRVKDCNAMLATCSIEIGVKPNLKVMRIVRMRKIVRELCKSVVKLCYMEIVLQAYHVTGRLSEFLHGVIGGPRV